MWQFKWHYQKTATIISPILVCKIPGCYSRVFHSSMDNIYLVCGGECVIKCRFFSKSKPFCFQGKLCPLQIVCQLAAGLGSSAQVHTSEFWWEWNSDRKHKFSDICWNMQLHLSLILSFSHSLFLSTSACYEMKRLAVIPSAVVSGNKKCLLTPCPRIFFGLRCCSNVVTEHFAPRELELLCKSWYWFLKQQDKLGHEGERPPPYYSTFPPKNYLLNWGCYHAVCEAFL